MLKSIFLALAVLITVASWAQNPFIPSKLSDEVNSRFEELRPVLSPNDSVLYFSRKNHPHNKYGVNNSQDIWFCELQPDGSWSKAKRMPDVVNMARYNVVYAVTDNGNTLIIGGVFNNRRQWVERGLSKVTLRNGTWGLPVKVEAKFKKINEGKTSDVYISPDEKVMIVSSTQSFASHKNQFYVFNKRRGEWMKPKKVKIKHGQVMISPFLSSDKSTLYFSSRHRNGRYHIYSSESQDDTYRYWSDPVKLSDTINSPSNWDAYFVTNVKGDIAYFTSDRDQFNSDIYKVRLYEDRPYAQIDGFVVNQFKNEVLDGEKTFEIIVEQLTGVPDSNGTRVITVDTGDELLVDSLSRIIAPDSLNILQNVRNYTFQLPFGEVYRLRAVVDNYVSVPVELDLRDKYEYFEMNQDLGVEPLTFAKVKGFVRDIMSDSIMTNPDSLIYLSLNGFKFDSARVQQDGSYEFKLALGDQYKLAANKEGYKSIDSTINLNEVEEYVLIDQDVYLEKLPDLSVYYSLQLVDKSSGKAIGESVEYSVFVNGVETSVEKQISDSLHSFTLKLPLDSSYSFTLLMEDYMTTFDSLDVTGFTERTDSTKQLECVALEVGAAIVMKNIFFERNKAELKETSFLPLDDLVEFLNQYGSMKIEIGGHTDNVGAARYNKNLSQERAESVRAYLLTKGISENRITAEGYGFDEPIASNETEEGRAENRRVEFKILDK